MLFWTGLGDTQYVSGFCLSALLFLIPAPHRKVKTPEWTKNPTTLAPPFRILFWNIFLDCMLHFRISIP